MDIKGPLSTPSFRRHKYVLVFLDDHSRYSWVAFLSSNVFNQGLSSTAFNQIKRFFAQTGLIWQKYSWCCLRCDNAGENTSEQVRKWLTEQGIRLETSTPYKPWQDARVEIHICHRFSIARTVLIACDLKEIVWARAVSYANDIWMFNRVLEWRWLHMRQY